MRVAVHVKRDLEPCSFSLWAFFQAVVSTPCVRSQQTSLPGSSAIWQPHPCAGDGEEFRHSSFPVGLLFNEASRPQEGKYYTRNGRDSHKLTLSSKTSDQRASLPASTSSSALEERNIRTTPSSRKINTRTLPISPGHSGRGWLKHSSSVLNMRS